MKHPLVSFIGREIFFGSGFFGSFFLGYCLPGPERWWFYPTATVLVLVGAASLACMLLSFKFLVMGEEE